MKKYLLLMAAGIFGILTANAYTVTPNSDGSVTIDGGGYETITQVDGHGDQHTVVSGVSGAGLNNSFTAEQQALIKAAKKIIITGYINNMLAFQDLATQNSIEEVDMSGAVFEQNLNNVENVTYYQYDPESKTYNQVTKTYMKNVMSFKYFPSLTKATLPTQYLESICPATFDSNAALTTTFTIPSSVRYIATLAVDNTPIASIDIPANVEYINKSGFQNAAISALIAVNVNGYTSAAVDAFDRMTTVGQTDASYGNYASLTFPSNLDEGFFKNMNHPLSQATSLDKGAFQSWLRDHLNSTGINDDSQKNGWKQFINSGSTPPIPVPEGEKVVLRTFSDNIARLVPLGFRAYVVSGLKEQNEVVDGETKTNYIVKLTQIFAIPAYTGVILYGEIDERATSFSLSEIPSWNPGGSSYVEPYNRFSGDNEFDKSPKNYLVPTVTSTKIYPTYKDASMWDAIKDAWDSHHGEGVTQSWDFYKSVWPLSGDMKRYHQTGEKVKDRNFILANYKETKTGSKDNTHDDFVGFFRVISGVTCGKPVVVNQETGETRQNGQAYLSLPSTLFKSAKGGEALVVKPTEPTDMVFRSDVWNDPVNTGNWGQRGNIGVLESKFAGEVEETSGISSISSDVEEESGVYYTLQGVKVALPQKGVYIKNGKKVIIK